MASKSPNPATALTVAALPRHAATAAPAAAGDEPGHRAPALRELTGLATAEMDELIGQLAALRQAQRQEKARSHPASDARHKSRSALHLRLSLPDDTLAHLFSTSRTTIRRALTEIRHLLDQHGHRIEPVTAPPDLPARIPPHVPRTATLKTKVKEAC